MAPNPARFIMSNFVTIETVPHADFDHRHAQCFALGYNCRAQLARDISINLGLVDSNRSDGIAAGKLDVFAVALH